MRRLECDVRVRGWHRAFCLGPDRRYRGNGRQIAGGVVLGAVVAAGWYVTGHLGYGENPDTLDTIEIVCSFTRLGPTACGVT